MFYKKTTQGFTLLELLVVIAIIGVLASVVLASLNSSRVKARNAKVLSQIEEYKKAFDLMILEYGEIHHNWTGNNRRRTICLGGGVGTNRCLGSYTFGGVINDAWNTEIENRLNNFLPHQPRIITGSYSSPAYSGCTVGGAVNLFYNTGGQNCENTQYSLWFILEGQNQDCGKASQVNPNFEMNNVTVCRLMGN